MTDIALILGAKMFLSGLLTEGHEAKSDKILRDKMPRTAGFCELFCESSPSLPWQQGQGSMVGTPVELSDNNLQNLLHKAFCHLVHNPSSLS